MCGICATPNHAANHILSYKMALKNKLEQLEIFEDLLNKDTIHTSALTVLGGVITQFKL